jgi:phage shock protein C
MTAKTGLYRSRNNRRICGVCGGVAEYFDASPFWIRFGVLALMFITGIWPVLLTYFLMALILKPSPVYPIQDEDDRDFYESFMRSPANAADRLKRQFENLDRRIRRMEDAVTNRTFEWDKRFNHTNN